MSFRLSTRGTRPAQASPGPVPAAPHAEATLYEVSLCPPTAPALPLRGTETSERRRFLDSLGQAAAGPHSDTWGAGGEAQWRAQNNQVRSLM